jgi:hypothetical protein
LLVSALACLIMGNGLRTQVVDILSVGRTASADHRDRA